MDIYRKFCVDMTALVLELSETAIPDKKSDKWIVDGQTFRLAMEKANTQRNMLNHNMEFKLSEERRRLRTKVSQPKPKESVNEKTAA